MATMVLGMSWVKPRSIGFSSTTAETSIVDPVWLADRGRFVMKVSADLVGGFPGYARHCGRLQEVDLRLYERAIVVDEGTAGGFALALAAIQSLDASEATGRVTPTLRIRYLNGATTRLFFATIRPTRPSLRTTRPEPSLLQQLAEHGAATGSVAAIPVDAVRASLEQQARLADEDIIWSGPASAPRYPGGEPIAVEIWVTTESLVWAAPGATTVDRVPLTRVRDVAPGQAGARGHLAVAYVGIGFGEHDRVEIPFVFDTRANASANGEGRDKMVGALRSRSIPVIEIDPPWQPWRSASSATMIPTVWPSHVTPVGVSSSLDEALRQAPPVAVSVPERPRTNLNHADRLRPDRGVIVHYADQLDRYGYVVREDPFAAPRPAPVSTREPANADTSHAAGPSAPTPTPFVGDATAAPEPSRAVSAAAHLEALAVAAIKSAYETITHRRNGDWASTPAIRPASDAARAAALAEVIDDMVSGKLEPATGGTRKIRLETLADAAVSLHRLLDDHAAGRVSIEQLIHERIVIDSNLTRTVSCG